jgi:hypothetical protein
MHNITDRITPWIDAAIDEHGLGENILWEGTLLPGADGQPLYTIVVWMPGALLGTVSMGSFQVPDILNFSEEATTEMITEFLRAMREARSQQIAQSAPPPRGGQTPSGILIP